MDLEEVAPKYKMSIFLRFMYLDKHVDKTYHELYT